MKKVLLLPLLLLLLPLLTGCGPKAAAVCDAFDKGYRDFNRKLRWQEAENAGMVYMADDLRDEFMKAAEGVRKRKVAISDYRVLVSSCNAEQATGEVVAEFEYYILPSNRIKTLTYRQKWSYREATKQWRLQSGLPAFE